MDVLETSPGATRLQQTAELSVNEDSKMDPQAPPTTPPPPLLSSEEIVEVINETINTVQEFEQKSINTSSVVELTNCTDILMQIKSETVDNEEIELKPVNNESIQFETANNEIEIKLENVDEHQQQQEQQSNIETTNYEPVIDSVNEEDNISGVEAIEEKVSSLKVEHENDIKECVQDDNNMISVEQIEKTTTPLPFEIETYSALNENNLIDDFVNDCGNTVKLEDDIDNKNSDSLSNEYSITELSEHQLFKNIKFAICEDIVDLERVKKVLINNGAKFLNYLTDSTTHLIADNGEHSYVSEAVDIYEKPVVTSQWVWLSLRAKKVLPIKPFCPIKCDQLFSTVTVCPSMLTKDDRKRIWSMVTYYGGRFQTTLNANCTHLITTSIHGAKYEWACQTGLVKIVTPDWIIDCIQQNILCPEVRYDPKLLITFNDLSHLSATNIAVSDNIKQEIVEKKSVKSVTMSISTESVSRKTDLINESLLEQSKSEMAAISVPSTVAQSTNVSVAIQPNKMIQLNSINSRFPNQMLQQRPSNSMHAVRIKGSKIVSSTSTVPQPQPGVPSNSAPINVTVQRPAVANQQQQQPFVQQPQYSVGTQQQPPPRMVVSSLPQQQLPPQQYSQQNQMIQQQQPQQMTGKPRQVYLTLQQQQQQQMFNNSGGQFPRQFVPRPSGPQPNMVQVQQRAMARPVTSLISKNGNNQQPTQQQQMFRQQIMRNITPQQQYATQSGQISKPNMTTQVVTNQIYLKQQQQQQQQVNMLQQRAQINPNAMQRVPQPPQPMQSHMAPSQTLIRQNQFQMTHHQTAPQHMAQDTNVGGQQQPLVSQPQRMMIRIAVPPDQQKMQQQQQQQPNAPQIAPNYAQQQPGPQSPVVGPQQMIGRPVGQMMQVNNNNMQTRMMMRQGVHVQYQMAQQQQQPQAGQSQVLIRPGQMAGAQQQQLGPQQMQYIRQPQQLNQARWQNAEYNNPQQQQQPQFIHIGPRVNSGMQQTPQQQQVWLQQQQVRRFPIQASQMIRIQKTGPNGAVQQTMLPSASSTLANLSAMQHEQKVRANINTDQVVTVIPNNNDNVNNNNGSNVNQQLVTTNVQNAGLQQQTQQQVQVNLPAAKTILVSTGAATAATTIPVNTNNYQVSFVPSNATQSGLNSSNSNSPSSSNSTSGNNTGSGSVVNEKTKTALANLLNNRLNQQQQNGQHQQQTPPPPAPQTANVVRPQQVVGDNTTNSSTTVNAVKPATTVRIPHLVTGVANNSVTNSMAQHQIMAQQQNGQPMPHMSNVKMSPITSLPPSNDMPMSTIHHAPVPSQQMNNTASQIPYSYSQIQNRVPLSNPSLPSSLHPMGVIQRHPLPPGAPPSVYPNAPNSGPHVGQLVHQSNQHSNYHSHPRVQIRFFGHDSRGQIPSDQCFIGCVFFIGPSYTENASISHLIPGWKKKIEKFGGRVVDQYISSPNNEITHVVTEHMQCPLPKQALQDNIRCVTIYWLDDVLSNQRLLPPWRFYHLPVAYNFNRPCRNHIITISNFTGEEKLRIAKLIELTGAKFTNYLSKSNTILICKKLQGKKFEKAIEWRIAVVNLQWLHDILFGHLDALQLASLSKKYQTFDSNSSNNDSNVNMSPTQMLQRDLFRLDYSIVATLMNPWRTPIKLNDTTLTQKASENCDTQNKVKVSEQESKQDTNMKRSFDSMNSEDSKDSSTLEASNNNEKSQTESLLKRPKLESDEIAENKIDDNNNQNSATLPKENNDESVPTKEETAKMLIPIEDVNSMHDKEGGECCSNSSNGSSSSTITENQVNNGTQVLKTEENSVSSGGATEISTEENNSQFKVPLLNGTKTVLILFTGVPMKDRQQLTLQVESLGGKIVNDPTECTHLVLDYFVHTFKFFAAFSHAQHIVSSKWIKDSYKVGKFLEEDEYPVKDDEAESLFEINLQQCASMRTEKLFENIVFFVTPSCMPSRVIIKKLVELNGGVAELTKLPNRRQLDKMKLQNIRFVVVSCDNDLHTCDYFYNNHIDVVSTDFILNAILRQKFDFDLYSLRPKKN